MTWICFYWYRVNELYLKLWELSYLLHKVKCSGVPHQSYVDNLPHAVTANPVCVLHRWDLAVTNLIIFFSVLCNYQVQIRARTPPAAPGALGILMSRGCILCVLTSAAERTCMGSQSCGAQRGRSVHHKSPQRPLCPVCRAGVTPLGFCDAPSCTESSAIKASMTVACYELPTVSDTYGGTCIQSITTEPIFTVESNPLETTC